MSVYYIAEQYAAKYHSVEYPERPSKPQRKDFSSNTAWGIALDDYETKQEQYRQQLVEVRVVLANIETKFKDALAKELGLEGHPKFPILYRIAYEQGHSSGFTEVAQFAEMLSELLTDPKETEAVNILKLIQGQNWRLDNSVFGKEIKRRALKLLE